MSAYEGGLNFYPDPPPERWRELYMEAAAELARVRADLARAEARLQPLSFDRLQSVMSRHFGGAVLTDDEADSAEAFARAVERAHGIDAAIAAHGAA